MKSIFPLLLLPVFFACNQNNNQIQNHAAATNASETVASGATSVTGFRKTFTGKINSRYPIVLQLTRKDNLLEGTYFYENQGMDINLRGTAKGNLWELGEYDGAGNKTAEITGKLAGNVFTGKWSSLTGGKNYPVGLVETDKEVKPLPANPEGTYRNPEDTGCKLALTIHPEEGGYSYTLKSGNTTKTGNVAFIRSLEENKNYILLKPLSKEVKTASQIASTGQKHQPVEGLLEDGEITFQNSGNSMNYYLRFPECEEKYITLNKQ